MKARFDNVEDLCERRGTLRVEAGDGCLLEGTLPTSAVVRSAWPPTLSLIAGRVSPFVEGGQGQVGTVPDRRALLQAFERIRCSFWHGVGQADPSVARLAAPYRPRKPTETVLYRAVRDHLETFLAHARESYQRPLPRYVEKELRGYLKCGGFAYGFVHCGCDACGHDLLVSFSCKGRGVCPVVSATPIVWWRRWWADCSDVAVLSGRFTRGEPACEGRAAPFREGAIVVTLFISRRGFPQIHAYQPTGRVAFKSFGYSASFDAAVN